MDGGIKAGEENFPSMVRKRDQQGSSPFIKPVPSPKGFTVQAKEQSLKPTCLPAGCVQLGKLSVQLGTEEGLGLFLGEPNMQTPESVWLFQAESV